VKLSFPIFPVSDVIFYIPLLLHSLLNYLMAFWDPNFLDGATMVFLEDFLDLLLQDESFRDFFLFLDELDLSSSIELELL
jgi:hypothetical protein